MPASYASRLARFFLVLAVVAPSLVAQEVTETPVNQSDDPLLSPFVWRSIGPIGQGGRVDDIAVDPTDPHTFFVGFATAGLWKTTNNGVTFRDVFATYETSSIGDVAIAPSDPSIVWVGTGEVNNRQSSSFGAGIYKSVDGGESYVRMGLANAQSISRIVVHPSDPDVVWAAVNGHLFGPNEERGVYKTTDGGETGEKVLYVDENTGATDLVIHPTDPNVLFAATYQRRRTACCFVGGGPGSGIWRSTDGGDTWTRLEGNGLPRGTMGRIALAMTPADPDVVYAQIEVAADRETPLTDSERAEWEALDDDDELPPDPQWSGVWRSTDGGDTWEFRSNENGRPMYFSQIRVDPNDPEIVYVVDQRVHKSTDGGLTFETLSGYGHVDQHALWINPDDSDHILIGNDGSVDRSYDQGETWESLRGWDVAQPYHASADMRRPYFVCTGLQDNGSWCGPSSVRSGPILPEDWYRVGGGDGFYTAVDPTNYEIVYSESQNGNLGRYDLSTGERVSIRPRGASSQRFGSGNIVPTPPEGTEVRFNWNTPLVLSPHNPEVVYAGGNYFFRSMNRGDTWTMSEDLTKNVDRDQVEVMGVRNDVPRCSQLDRGQECNPSRNDGVSRYSTIVTIAESPIVPGLLWVGTDDGNVQLSRDGGASWTEVGRNVPGGTMQYYISRVEASHHDPATAFISIDGHRSDDLAPYVFVTHDYGETWQDISANLPEYGNVNTVRQDPRNADLLYAGTEFGFFVSMDGGMVWHRLMSGLGTTRIDDVFVHPRENDLVLATHGRGVQIMDDITPLQGMTSEVLASDAHLFTPREAVRWLADQRRSRSVTGDQAWRGENAPSGTAIDFYLRDAEDDIEITITALATGEVFRNIEVEGVAGLNRVQWDLRGNSRQGGAQRGRGGFGQRNRGPLADPGLYRVTLSAAGDEYSETVTVLEDVWLDQR